MSDIQQDYVASESEVKSVTLTVLILLAVFGFGMVCGVVFQYKLGCS